MQQQMAMAAWQQQQAAAMQRMGSSGGMVHSAAGYPGLSMGPMGFQGFPTSMMTPAGMMGTGYAAPGQPQQQQQQQAGVVGSQAMSTGTQPGHAAAAAMRPQLISSITQGAHAFMDPPASAAALQQLQQGVNAANQQPMHAAAAAAAHVGRGQAGGQAASGLLGQSQSGPMIQVQFVNPGPGMMAGWGGTAGVSGGAGGAPSGGAPGGVSVGGGGGMGMIPTPGASAPSPAMFGGVGVPGGYILMQQQRMAAAATGTGGGGS
jgi:hypothetical protein